MEMMWCHNCGWVGPEDELVPGIPLDVDIEGDGAEMSYYASTPSCCPDCSHSPSGTDEI